MSCSQNIVSSSVNTFSLQFSRLAPEKKHHIPLLTVQGTYCGICKLLPALLGMRVCLMGSHSQTYIEEQNPLLCPLQRQTAVSQLPANLDRALLETWLLSAANTPADLV